MALMDRCGRVVSFSLVEHKGLLGGFQQPTGSKSYQAHLRSAINLTDLSVASSPLFFTSRSSNVTGDPLPFLHSPLLLSKYIQRKSNYSNRSLDVTPKTRVNAIFPHVQYRFGVRRNTCGLVDLKIHFLSRFPCLTIYGGEMAVLIFNLGV